MTALRVRPYETSKTYVLQLFHGLPALGIGYSGGLTPCIRPFKSSIFR